VAENFLNGSLNSVENINHFYILLWPFYKLGMSTKLSILLISYLCAIFAGCCLYLLTNLISNRNENIGIISLGVFILHPLSVRLTGNPSLFIFADFIFICGTFMLLYQLHKNFTIFLITLTIILFTLSILLGAKNIWIFYGMSSLLIVEHLFVCFRQKIAINFKKLLYLILITVFTTLSVFVYNRVFTIKLATSDALSSVIKTHVSKEVVSETKKLKDNSKTQSRYNLEEYFNKKMSKWININKTLIKLFFSPLFLFIPICFLFFLEQILTIKRWGIFTFIILILIVLFFKLDNFKSTDYTQFFILILFSTPVMVLGITLLKLEFKNYLFNLVIIILLPCFLLLGVGGRLYRDFYRLESAKGLKPVFQKTLKSNDIIYTPFGHDVKYFKISNLMNKLNLKVRPIEFLNINDLKKIFKSNEKKLYLFLDDYFFREHYYRGQFLKKIKTEKIVGNIKIKRLATISKDSPNIGYFFVLTKR